MSTFLCEKCGAIENTATSNYWLNKMENYPVLCSKCETGKWHNRFERRHWSYYGVEEILQANKAGNGDFINAKEHFINIGVIGNKKDAITEIPWED